MAILKKLATLNADSRWWIKGDGTDVLKGLWESVSGEWAGDVDLNDGELRQMYDQYKEKINWVQKIGLQSHGIEDIKQELKNARDTLSIEIDFVSSGTYFKLYAKSLYP